MSDPILTVMSDVEQTVASPTSTLSDVWKLMREARIQHIPILDGDVLVGLVSGWDIARASMEPGGKDPAELTAGDVMETALERLHPKDTVDKATAMLCDGHFHSIPVVDDEERLVGIVTTTDLLRHHASS